MRRRFQRLPLLFAIVLVVLLGVSATGFAQESGQELTAPAADPAVIGQEAADLSLIDYTARTDDGRVMVYVELQAEAAAITFARSGGAEGGTVADSMMTSQAQIVQAEQANFVANIAAMGINAQVLEQTDTVLNTVMLAVAASDVAALRARPEVRNVYPVTLFEREHQTSVPFIGAPAAWNGTFGGAYTGQGIIVGVIDTGIDYTHRHFGGSGVWPTNPADRTTTADTFVSADNPFGSTKVVGGWDYVGDAYNGGNPETSGLPASNTAVPDPDPIDCTTVPADLNATFGRTPSQSPSGHGSHVAGTVAGYGVNADGTTYTGGYASVDFGALKIGPGVAPEAQLVAFRVFGCFGSTGFALAALDDAVAGTHSPKVDVVNMSLGSAFGYNGDDPFINPYIVAIQNATAAGTLVVMSAGNNYDTHFITGSPGSTPSGMAVASVSDGDYPQITVAGTTADGNYAVRTSIGSPPNAVSGPWQLAMPTGNGCAASNYANWPADRVAMVLFTGACGSNGLVAAAAGATPNAPRGLLVISNAPGDFQNLACAATTPYVPCVSITSTLGDLLTANIATATVTFNPALQGIDTTFVDAVSSFSSRGPGRDGDYGIKPDIAAPGGSILSTASGTGSNGQLLGGTSMAAPHVAGVAALLMSNPMYASWSTLQLKALMMNTANNDVFLNTSARPRLGPQRMGAGRVDVPDAMSSEVIAYNALRPDVVSVSFGSVEYTPGVTSTRTAYVTIANRSDVPVTYDLTVDTYTDANGASFSVSPTSITVQPFDSEEVDVILTLNLPTTGTPPHNWSDGSQLTTQPNAAGTQLARAWITEEGAILKLNPTAGATIPLRVPLYAAPRAASSMRAATTEVDAVGGAVGTAGLGLAGTTVNTGGSVPYDVQANVAAFQLTGADAIGDGGYWGLPEADLQYVGVMSNFDQPDNPLTGANDPGSTGGSVNGNTLVQFAVTTAGDWDTLNELSFRVYIDGQCNGFGTQSDNYVSFSQSVTSNNTQSDIFQNFWRISSSSSGFSHGNANLFAANQLETYVYNNNVVILPLLAGATANYDGVAATPATSVIAAGDQDFCFYVESFHRSWGVVDTTPVMYYNLANPVIDTMSDASLFGSGSTGWYADAPGTVIPFDYNVSGWQVGDPTPQLLVVHQMNQPNMQNADGIPFRRAEVVRLDVETADLSAGISATPEDMYFFQSRNVHVELSVTNNGADPAEPHIHMTLPGTVSYVSGDAVCVHSGEPVGGTLTCDFDGALLAGDTWSAHVDLDVDPNFVGSLTLTATVDDEGNMLDPVDSNDSASTNVPVPPSVPTPLSPGGAVPENNPTIVWTSVLGGQWYELRVWSVTDGALSAEIFSQWYDGTAVCAGSTCSATPALNLPTGQYYSNVRAWHATGGYSQWGLPLWFTVATPTPTPILVAPNAPTTNTNPAFNWLDVPGADQYYVWVDMTSTGPEDAHIADRWFMDSAVCDGYNCWADLGLNLEAGYYVFWVQAWSDTGGYSVWSAGMNFAVAIPPMTPAPVAPMGSIMTNTPAFVWQTDNSAEWHMLWVADGSGTLWSQWYADAAICDAFNMCSVTLPMWLGTGYYTWWAQSYSTVGGYSAWTAGVNFTVATPTAAPTPVAPNGALTPGSVPTFIFNPSAGATWYYIWVAGPNGHVLDQWFQSSICAGSFCTAMPGVAMNDVGAYRWWVQAWSAAGGYSDWSAPMSYSVVAPAPEGEEPGGAGVPLPEEVTPEATADGG